MKGSKRMDRMERELRTLIATCEDALTDALEAGFCASIDGDAAALRDAEAAYAKACADFARAEERFALHLRVQAGPYAVPAADLELGLCF